MPVGIQVTFVIFGAKISFKKSSKEIHADNMYIIQRCVYSLLKVVNSQLLSDMFKMESYRTVIYCCATNETKLSRLKQPPFYSIS